MRHLHVETLKSFFRYPSKKLILLNKLIAETRHLIKIFVYRCTFFAYFKIKRATALCFRRKGNSFIFNFRTKVGRCGIFVWKQTIYSSDILPKNWFCLPRWSQRLQISSKCSSSDAPSLHILRSNARPRSVFDEKDFVYFQFSYKSWTMRHFRMKTGNLFFNCLARKLILLNKLIA